MDTNESIFSTDQDCILVADDGNNDLGQVVPSDYWITGEAECHKSDKVTDCHMSDKVKDKLLVIGGHGRTCNSLASGELFDMAEKPFKCTPKSPFSLSVPVYEATGTVLRSTDSTEFEAAVIICGGKVNTSEIFERGCYKLQQNVSGSTAASAQQFAELSKRKCCAAGVPVNGGSVFFVTGGATDAGSQR